MELSGHACPKCGGDSRVIARTPRNGVFPEMLTLKCGECGDIFTAPGDPERGLPDPFVNRGRRVRPGFCAR